MLVPTVCSHSGRPPRLLTHSSKVPCSLQVYSSAPVSLPQSRFKVYCSERALLFPLSSDPFTCSMHLSRKQGMGRVRRAADTHHSSAPMVYMCAHAIVRVQREPPFPSPHSVPRASSGKEPGRMSPVSVVVCLSFLLTHYTTQLSRTCMALYCVSRVSRLKTTILYYYLVL